ncbi:MAG TPA: hypothetical protein VLA56_15665 [Pseudomonadales bacterium]|nr:hypothetical protein [Pseudomonadales bacterium]
MHLDLPVDLCVVADADRAKALVGVLDPVILEGSEAEPAELFEDDLLLGLRERPDDHWPECPSRPVPAPETAAVEGAERENPFAVLASLKKKQGDD